MHIARNRFTNHFNHLVDSDLDLPAAPALWMGNPAGRAGRPRNGGVGRSSFPAAERVSGDLRRGAGSFLGLVSAGGTLALAGSGDRDPGPGRRRG